MKMTWVTVTLSDTKFFKTVRDNFRMISDSETHTSWPRFRCLCCYDNKGEFSHVL